jgi:hypothetical protein
MKASLEFLVQLNPIFQLLTLIALIAYVWKTWTMASATSKAAHASEESIREMRLSREEQAKPKVVCYCEHNKTSRRFFDFVIKNYGNSTAFNVRLVFSPQILWYGLGRVDEKTFKIMPPGYEWRTFWPPFPVPDHPSIPDEFTANITYEWDNPLKHEEYVVGFDIKSLMGSGSLSETTMGDTLQRISEIAKNVASEDSLHEIAESVKEVAKLLEKQARAKRH